VDGEDTFDRLLESASILIEVFDEGIVLSLHRFLGPIARISLAMFAHRFASATWSGWWIKPAQPLT
jgi:hypothetical protein